MKKLILIYYCIVSLLSVSQAQQIKSILHQKILSLPGATVKVVDSDSHFKEAFEIFITQPVDHMNPNNGPKFTQRIYLRHVDFVKPMIFNNEGYATSEKRRTELAKILKCNEMFVEHRYFGESKPDSSLGWKYLTTAQAAADHKRLVDLFKSMYKGKWVSTGISKGGQSTIFFKYYYPNAVDVWVPYVAPLNLEQEDSRIFTFLNHVGTESCRNKIKSFQRAVLKNRNSILPLLENHAMEKGYSFYLGLEKTFDYAVLEYSFSFWQWGRAGCEEIPDSSASPDSLLKHLYTTSSFNYFDSKSVNYYKPFYYQAYSEIGYYGYEIKEFSDLLVDVKGDYASSILLAPQEAEFNFDKNLMVNINSFIQDHGNNMMYIYGEYDTWSATAVHIGTETNAVKMVKKEGSHRTRIKSFNSEEKEKIYSILEDWLEYDIIK